MNSVLLSTLWYYLSLWRVSTSILNSICASLRNYLWAGTEEHSRARVHWTDCCASKEVGGLGLIDPHEAPNALTTKWIVKAMLPGPAPLALHLRHRLAGVQPLRSGIWPSNLQFALLAQFSASRGSPIWTGFIKSYRRFSPQLGVLPPRNVDEVRNTQLWWTIYFIGSNFGFSPTCARTLAARGLHCLRNLWNHGLAIPCAYSTGRLCNNNMVYWVPRG